MRAVTGWQEPPAGDPGGHQVVDDLGDRLRLAAQAPEVLGGRLPQEPPVYQVAVKVLLHCRQRKPSGRVPDAVMFVLRQHAALVARQFIECFLKLDWKMHPAISKPIDDHGCRVLQPGHVVASSRQPTPDFRYLVRNRTVRNLPGCRHTVAAGRLKPGAVVAPK